MITFAPGEEITTGALKQRLERSECCPDCKRPVSFNYFVVPGLGPLPLLVVCCVACKAYGQLRASHLPVGRAGEVSTQLEIAWIRGQVL